MVAQHIFKSESSPSSESLPTSESLQVAERGVRSLRLQTLVTLRWLAVFGQSAAVLVSTVFLDVELPLVGCAVAITVSVWLNLIAAMTVQPTQRLSERDALLALIFDLTQLSALLYMTGGLTNPFALFLLAPVTISATVLSLRTTLILGAVSIAATTLLSQYYLPLHTTGGERIEPHPIYLAGSWVAISLGVTFQAAYTRRVSNEALNMSAALNATQMALEREMRLSSIGALAAAAAHELGTPLATIKLVAGELQAELEDAALREDAQLISEQAARCRRILEKLSTVQTPDDEQTRQAPITAVVWEAARPHLTRKAEVRCRLNGVDLIDPAEGETDAQPQIPRRPEIIQGLRNIVQNAVDFADGVVLIDVDTRGETVSVTIRDDGPGFSQDVLAHLGEPFNTSRARGDRNGYEGMGLGVFIAKTLLERTGATVSFRNRRRRGGASSGEVEAPGASVRVTWPRGMIATARESGRRGKVEPSRSEQTPV
ncbi:MAG: ActS/PrrB/RegB family redox-sensitive histidine kinase [Neomegalonema sp.]|nr:ActS/PrrB/RegB family redox-sensitive histidine kinase [Neomegalonema sp.]